MNLETLTITEARRALDAKEYSALELTNAYLDAIAQKDGEIHAYLEAWEDSAREEAKAADAVIAAGKSQPLTGIPIAVKDNMLIEGRIVSAASKILESYRASYDATVISKLKAQGVVFLGRTNMDEFALGSSTENSAYGPTKNPHDTSRVPGRTSGGSTAAVAAGMGPGGIGSIGKTVADTKVILDSIQGHDANDSTSLPDSFFANKKPVRKVLGVPRAFLGKGMEPDMLAAFENSLTALSQKGYTLVDIELPALDYALAVYYIINPAEVSTNLARLDGIRYGLSVPAD